MIQVLEYSPSKKIIALYFAVAIGAGLFSSLIFYVFISLILLWFICKRLFRNYIKKRKFKQTLKSIQRIFRG